MSKILIVQENEKNMKLVRDILQRKGHETLGASTGEEGVHLALAHSFLASVQRFLTQGRR
jgi:two-component system, cell cycle response regulator DivK